MKKQLKKLACGVLCASLLATCALEGVYLEKADAQVNTEELSGATNTYDVSADTALPFTQEQLYSQIFDIKNTVSISVDMTNSEIKKLQSDFEKNSKSPIYRMANVTISISTPNGTTNSYYYDEVGIRLKGNTTRKDLYSENDGILNLDHFKLKFNETFDSTDDGYNNGEYYIDASGNSTWDTTARKARKKRVFGNMEKMDVKWNSNIDTTYLREYYSYELFRQEGIAAPHIGLTTMKMNITDKTANSAYLGVYTIHEPVDSEFIKNNLLSSENNYILNASGDYTDGDLYKAGWDNEYGNWIGANMTTGCSYGVTDDLKGKDYNYDLKTNKKKSTLAPISNLLQGLKSVSSKADLAKYVDMDYFVKFAAVAYVTGNGDDMRNNYNNYYLYFYTDNTDASNPVQKAIVIPYDYDRCFGITNGMNSDGTGMTAVDPFSTKATAQGNQDNPLYKYSVCRGGYYVDEYTAALKKVMENELLTMDKFKEYYEIAKKNYSDKVTPSKNFNNTLNSDSNTKITKENFYFTLDTTNDAKNINTTSTNQKHQNLIISEYLSKMLATLSNAIGAPINSEQECYIRGEFSSWNVDGNYRMTYSKASGLYSYKLTIDGTKNFKIYNNTTDKWYGYADISGNIPNGISEGSDSGNIQASSGTYYIIYDASNNKMQISLNEIETETTTEKETTTETEQTTTQNEATSKEETTTPQETTEIESDSTNSQVINFVFNANGGKIGSSKIAEKTVNADEKIGKLPSPVRKKYTFAGWYTKKTGGNKVTASTVADSEISTTLYAHWTKVSVGKATLSSVKNVKSLKAAVVIKKVSGAKGYEVSYALKKTFKSSKTVTAKSLKATISKLKKGKTYYVRVRAYKLDSANAKVYGSYSAVKKLKISK